MASNKIVRDKAFELLEYVYSFKVLAGAMDRNLRIPKSTAGGFGPNAICRIGQTLLDFMLGLFKAMERCALYCKNVRLLFAASGRTVVNALKWAMLSRRLGAAPVGIARSFPLNRVSGYAERQLDAILVSTNVFETFCDHLPQVYTTYRSEARKVTVVLSMSYSV